MAIILHKYKTLLSDTFIFAFGTFGSKLILFFLVPIYTHALSPEQYGTAELVLTIGQLILPFISLTIFDALLRFGLMRNGRREDALCIAMFLFIVGSLITIVFTYFFPLYQSIAIWKWYLCAYIIVSFFSNNTLIYLKIKNQNKLYAILSIAQSLLLLLCNVLLLIVWHVGIKGYLLSIIISLFVTATLAFIMGSMPIELKNAKFDRRLLQNMVLFSAPLIINNVSWWLIHATDKMMIEYFITTSALGLYAAASKIPSLLNIITSIFNQAWILASIKEYDSSNESLFYSNVFRCFILILFGMCIGITFIIKPFMSIYVGSSFKAAWTFVPILLVSAIFSGISAFCGSLYSAVKQSKNVMFTTLLASFINVLVNFMLIPRIGVYGAVIGTLCSYISICVFRMVDLKRYISIDFSLKVLLLVGTISLIQALLVTFNWHVYTVSGGALILFIFIVRKDIQTLIGIIKHK